VVAIPDFKLSTAQARQVLPNEYSRADAIFNTAHLGLLLRGLETGKSDGMRSALQDRIPSDRPQDLRTTVLLRLDRLPKCLLHADPRVNHL
jgi:homoserine kinase